MTSCVLLRWCHAPGSLFNDVTLFEAAQSHDMHVLASFRGAKSPVSGSAIPVSALRRALGGGSPWWPVTIARSTMLRKMLLRSRRFQVLTSMSSRRSKLRRGPVLSCVPCQRHGSASAHSREVSTVCLFLFLFVVVCLVVLVCGRLCARGRACAVCVSEFMRALICCPHTETWFRDGADA